MIVRHLKSCVVQLAASLLALVVVPAAGESREEVRFAAPTPGGNLVLAIHAATDIDALEPLIRDFQAASAPDVTVTYTEYQTNDLFAVARDDCLHRSNTGRSSAQIDVIISSSVDQLVKLVNDGCATPHRSRETAAVPDWAKWRDEVFGFTFEPALIVYNRDLVPSHQVPRTRVELVELLRSRPELYAGKVVTYDVTQSGIGYLFAFYDAYSGATTYGRLIEALGRARAVVRPTSADMVADIAGGRLLIGYNVLGSYAYRALRDGAPIGIVVPREYALVLSRGVMIPVGAKQPELAGRLLDYLLSSRGQQKASAGAFPFGFDAPLPPDIDGPVMLARSSLFRPISISVELLAVQDRAKRERFLTEWGRSLAPVASALDLNTP
ncbi:MAG: ABC transporter substrate-binding protein [Microvirga sp.]